MNNETAGKGLKGPEMLLVNCTSAVLSGAHRGRSQRQIVELVARRSWNAHGTIRPFQAFSGRFVVHTVDASPFAGLSMV
jgi:hypothetical protein